LTVKSNVRFPPIHDISGASAFDPKRTLDTRQRGLHAPPICKACVRARQRLSSDLQEEFTTQGGDAELFQSRESSFQRNVQLLL
jgi:hypothetical protein